MDDERVKSIVATLEGACTQLETELHTINADLEHASVCVRRYGDIYLAPLKYLTQLRDNKLARLREIISQLEGLKTQLDCSNALLHTLNASQPLALVPQPTIGFGSAARRY
jgi:hypothetical protein